MICAKIYLDRDSEGSEVLVIESVATSSPYCTVSPFFTTVRAPDRVAISPEAKERLARMLNDRSLFTPKRFSGNIGISEEHFYFEHCAAEGEPRRLTLPTDSPFTVCVERGWAPAAIAYMTPAKNDLLREMDMKAPCTRKELLDLYYAERRERGEETGCDIETIRRTPLAYLTEEQRAVIKREYHTDCDHYDSQDWHYHGDFIYDKIVSELGARFRKSYGEIEAIIR